MFLSGETFDADSALRRRLVDEVVAEAQFEQRIAAVADSVAVLFEHVLRRPLLSRSFMEMSLRDPDCAEIRRAFEDAAVARMTELIAAVCPRDVIPDPAATAYVVYGSTMQCAYGLAGHAGKPPVDARRVQTALVDFLVRALFP